MYDDLVKRLRAQADAERYFVGEDMLYDKAADAIEELSATISKMEKATRWIPAAERLPVSGVPVLICGDGNVVEQGFFDDEFGYWYDSRGYRTFVHHWMPLPEPPEEG